MSIECGPEHIGDEIVGVIDDLVEVGNMLEALGIVCNALERARASLSALIPFTHHLPVPAASATTLAEVDGALIAMAAAHEGCYRLTASYPRSIIEAARARNNPHP